MDEKGTAYVFLVFAFIIGGLVGALWSAGGHGATGFTVEDDAANAKIHAENAETEAKKAKIKLDQVYAKILEMDGRMTEDRAIEAEFRTNVMAEMALAKEQRQFALQAMMPGNTLSMDANGGFVITDSAGKIYEEPAEVVVTAPQTPGGVYTLSIMNQGGQVISTGRFNSNCNFLPDGCYSITIGGGKGSPGTGGSVPGTGGTGSNVGTGGSGTGIGGSGTGSNVAGGGSGVGGSGVGVV